MKEGDANTEYFHQHARYRKNKNFIGKLQVQNRLIVDQKEKKEAIWDFYNSLLGMVPPRALALNLEAFHRCPLNLHELEQMVTEEEVWHTIRSLPSDKAPGPDGYTGRFYKKVWPIIKMDFMLALKKVWQGDASRLYLLNSAYVTLLPK
jgi:hypothetical protein